MKLKHILSRQYSEDPSRPKSRSLPLIVSPLETKQEASHQHHHSPEEENLAPRNTSVSENPDGFQSEDSIPKEARTRIQLPQKGSYTTDEPRFRAHHEASSVELFYDLFFVANLATFTSNHPIADSESLKSYMGFFTLLWFTWFQTSIFDVRFGTDSVFSRVCKALHFGVMTGFAIVGPIFKTDEIERDNRAFRALSVIMMASRLILVVQYGSVAWFVRGYKRTLLPLVLLMATLFITGIIFLGLTWAFGPDKGEHAQDGWYVTAVAEAVLILAVSSQWRVLSFKHTHIVERVGLLTLIILGEGIIGMTKSVTKIMQGTTVVTGSSVGMVICAVLIIYFLYILYFDQIDHDRFGTVRQQIWAILHFPLHVGILLTVEGSSEFMIWRLAVELIDWTTSTAINDAKNVQEGQTEDMIKALNKTFTTVAHRFTAIAPLDYSEQYKELREVPEMNATKTEKENKLEEIIRKMLVDTYAWIFDNLGVETPEQDSEGGKGAEVDGATKLEEIGSVFGTVFLYFFIAAGCTLALLSVMYYFGKTHKTRGEMTSVVTRFIVGTGLALIATMYIPADGTVLGNFVASPWILPTVTLSYGLVIALDNIFIYFSNKRLERLEYEPA